MCSEASRSKRNDRTRSWEMRLHKHVTCSTPTAIAATVQLARIGGRTDQGSAIGTLQEWAAEPPPDSVRRPGKKRKRTLSRHLPDRVRCGLAVQNGIASIGGRGSLGTAGPDHEPRAHDARAGREPGH
jgi:hypothetical protein